MLADLWNHPYTFPHRRFRTQTSDDVAIAGIHVDRARTSTLIIYAHGFLSNKNHRRIPIFVELLSRRFDVITFDFRGHGESTGACTFTQREVLDLAAVVHYARSCGYQRIVTLGSSMGGAAVIRHAGLHGGVDGVATIGAFDDVQALRRPATAMALRLLFETPFGSTVTEIARGTRLDELWVDTQPIELIPQVQVPTLFIHGEWDHLIHPEASRRLYTRAHEPKQLVVVPRKGHDMPLLTDETAALLARWIRRYVDNRQ